MTRGKAGHKRLQEGFMLHNQCDPILKTHLLKAA